MKQEIVNIGKNKEQTTGLMEITKKIIDLRNLKMVISKEIARKYLKILLS